MDKFKNLFTDEVEFDDDDDDDEMEEPVKIKEVKKEKNDKDKLPTFMREKIKKEEKKEKEKVDDEIADFKIGKDDTLDVENGELDSISEDVVKKEEKKDNKFKFPIEFEENDFTDISRVSRQSRNKNHDMLNDTHDIQHTKEDIKTPQKKEIKKEVKVAELYKDKKEEFNKDMKKFQATPIISPIYGVLDKNYRQDEIETRGDNYEINRPSKNIDFDSVRKKAYGNKLEEDINNNLICENCDYYKNAKTCKKDIDKDNLMYEALCEKKEDKDITLDEALENYYDYGVEYEKTTEVDSFPLDEGEEVKIVNHDVEEEIIEEPKSKKNSVPPVKSSINMLSTLKKSMGDEEEATKEESQEKNLELTDDLFNLIDSMYDEGNEK